MRPIDPISPNAIAAARSRMRGVLHTPLIRLDAPEAPCRIWLKLENLQPIGSFKCRGALNAIRGADPAAIRRGVWTASAGNMAQGVAWGAREAAVPCRVVVPDTAPRTKVAAVERFGGTVDEVPFDDWWRLIERGGESGDGLFVHPVADPAVIAGNGTVGAEILEDFPDGEPLDAIAVPFGGGGLTCGIASAVKPLRAGVKVLGAEVGTARPLAASLAAGRAESVDYRPSFVDGIGGKGVLPAMWPLIRRCVDGAVEASPDETAAALRLIAERARVIAEGAGAVPVAAALAGRCGGGNVVCVVSGGNIDAAPLREILRGETPA